MMCPLNSGELLSGLEEEADENVEGERFHHRKNSQLVYTNFIAIFPTALTSWTSESPPSGRYKRREKILVEEISVYFP